MSKRNSKRPYGSGSIFEKHGAVHIKFYPAPGKRSVQRKICRVGELTDIEIERQAGRIIVEYKQPTGGVVPTVLEVANRYVSSLEDEGKSKSYINNRRRAIKNHLAPRIGDRPVDAVKPKDLRRMYSEMTRDTITPATRVSVHWLLSGTFRKAIEEEWRTDNPAAAVATPKYRPDDKITYLTVEEVDRVIGAIPDDSMGKVEQPLYRTFQHNGFRRGEELALHWRDCKFDLDSFFVSENYVEGEFKQPKGQRSRVVPMTPQAKEALLSWRKVTRFPAEDDLVFTLTGEPLRPEYVSKRFKAAVLRAKVGPVEMRSYKIRGKIKTKPFAKFKLHHLRDTFASHAMMNPNIAPIEVQNALGHANLATTSDRYAQFIPQADAAERFGASFVDRQPIDHQNPRAASKSSEDVATRQA
jgi:integrase